MSTMRRPEDCATGIGGVLLIFGNTGIPFATASYGQNTGSMPSLDRRAILIAESILPFLEDPCECI